MDHLFIEFWGSISRTRTIFSLDLGEVIWAYIYIILKYNWHFKNVFDAPDNTIRYQSQENALLLGDGETNPEDIKHDFRRMLWKKFHYVLVIRFLDTRQQSNISDTQRRE